MLNLHHQRGVNDVFSGASDVFPDVFDFLACVSVEADDTDVFRSTCPKDPSKISNREEVSVPARTILILPKLS